MEVPLTLDELKKTIKDTVTEVTAEVQEQIKMEVALQIEATRKEFAEKLGTIAFHKSEETLEEQNRFKYFGEQLVSVMRAAGGTVDDRLKYQQDAFQKQQGMSENIPSDGGFLVQQDFADELIRKVHQTGMLAARVRTIPISARSNAITLPGIDEQSRANGSRWGGILAYWQDEASEKTKSKPKFRDMTLKLKKLIGLAYATDELLADAAALEMWISDGFAEEFGFAADDAIYRGDGAGKPLGILNSGCLVTVTASGGSTTFLYEDAVNMYARLWARSRGNSVWLMNQDVIPQLLTMSLAVGTGGSPVYLPANGAADRPFDTLFGRPIMYIEQASTLGAVGDVMYCDLSQYLMAEKGGIQSASSIHVQFVTDETAFRFVWRVDGQPLWNTPLTPYQGTNTQSPFIVLAARP